MFSYFEYKKYIVNIHISETLKFYAYRYYMSLKVIILFFKYISIKHQVLPTIYDSISNIRNKLFFHSYFNSEFKFMYSNNIHYFYNSYISNKIIRDYNLIYYNIITSLNSIYSDSMLIECNYKSISMSYNYTIVFDKLVTFPSNSSFKEVKNLKSIISLVIKSNTMNYYLNRLLFSHILLNV